MDEEAKKGARENLTPDDLVVAARGRAQITAIIQRMQLTMRLRHWLQRMRQQKRQSKHCVHG